MEAEKKMMQNAYDTTANKTKKVREIAAAERIYHLLPKDQAEYLRSLWDEFEEGITKEARFAITLDKLQPLLLNDQTEGRSWREHEVVLEQVLQRNQNTHLGSEILWNYAKDIIDKNVEQKRLPIGKKENEE